MKGYFRGNKWLAQNDWLSAWGIGLLPKHGDHILKWVTSAIVSVECKRETEKSLSLSMI